MLLLRIVVAKPAAWGHRPRPHFALGEAPPEPNLEYLKSSLDLPLRPRRRDQEEEYILNNGPKVTAKRPRCQLRQPNSRASEDTMGPHPSVETRGTAPTH